MSSVKQVQDIFKCYLKNTQLCSEGAVPWEIKNSPLGGRGLFATRKILEGELLFREPPLVLGPRSDIKCNPVCVGCHRSAPPDKLFPCSAGCGLPVCGSHCELSIRHKQECALLGQRKNGFKQSTSWNRHVLTALAPLRCLLLGEVERDVLSCLEAHKAPQHDLTVNIVRQCMHGCLETSEAELIRLGCEVLDAVAFETPCPEGEEIGSLRGIYPLSAIINHDCSPNTRHCYDYSNRMIVEACKEIEVGEELTTTYTRLTWGTQARQHHLERTKRFKCCCRRCADPQEFGARLMALYCLKDTCSGVLLPVDMPTTTWRCEQCSINIGNSKVDILQRAISTAVNLMDKNNLRKSCKVLRKLSVVPSSNQMAVEFKIHLINTLGHEPGYLWEDLSSEELELKEVLCREILKLLKVLQLGECRLRGLTLFELCSTLREMSKRNTNSNMVTTVCEENKKVKEIEDLLTDAKRILRYDQHTIRLIELQEK